MRKKLFTLFLSFSVIFVLVNCQPASQNSASQSGLALAVLGLGGASTSAAAATESPFSPNNTVLLSSAVSFQGGSVQAKGTLIDLDGDGLADIITISSADSSGGGTNSSISLLLVDLDADKIPDGIDPNGDGTIDYYMSMDASKSVRLSTLVNGGGNSVTLVLGQGFDSDGDGIVDNPILAQLANDITAPISTIVPAGGTYSAAQSLTISCSDNIAPGNIVYTTNGTIPILNPVNGVLRRPPNSNLVIGSAGNGTYMVRAFCRDVAGNLSASHTELYVIDASVPNITASLNSGYVSNNGGAINSSQLSFSSDKAGNFTIRLGGTSCSDGTQLSSGSITAGATNTATSLNASSLAVGSNTIRVCVSAAGGLIGSYALSLVRDDTPPTVTPSPAGGGYTRVVSVTLTCSDAGGAGCDKVAYSSATGSAPTSPSISGTTGNISSGNLYSTAITSVDKTTTYIKYLARDRAGNVSSVNTGEYIVDTELASPVIVSTLGTGTEILLEWTNIPAANEYELYYSSSSPVTTSSTKISGLTGTRHKLTGLSSDTLYYLRVKAINTTEAMASNLSGEQAVFTISTAIGTAASGSYINISTGQANSSGNSPSIVVDQSSSKILVAAQGSQGELHVVRCDLNGTNCVSTDISSATSAGINSGYTPNALIDFFSNKLLVLTKNVTNNSKLSLFRCNLNLTGCTHTDISVGQGTNSAFYISAVIDSINKKLLVATRNLANSGDKLSLFRCDLDGTNCSHTNISAGQADSSAGFPFALVDLIGKKLLVLATNSTNNNKLSLFRCDLDGTNCTHSDLSASQGTNSGQEPSAVIDPSANKLLVATRNGANSGKLGLYRCNLDGTSCTHTDISAGQGTNSGTGSKTFLDPISEKLLIVTQNTANSSKLSLFRCNLDGTSSTYKDLSSGQGAFSGMSPSLTVDPISGKLLVATQNNTNNSKLALFRW